MKTLERLRNESNKKVGEMTHLTDIEQAELEYDKALIRAVLAEIKTPWESGDRQVYFAGNADFQKGADWQQRIYDQNAEEMLK